MRKNRSRKEEEAYERLMKQQEKLKKNQAVQKTEGSQKYVAAGNKSAYEAGQNSVGSGRQGWIREKNGGIRLQLPAQLVVAGGDGNLTQHRRM